MELNPIIQKEGKGKVNKSQHLLEAWTHAEKLQQDLAQKKDPQSHHYNQMIQQHLELARGKDRRVKTRAQSVLRHFVKWHEAKEIHKEKHKKIPDMDALAAGHPKAISSWRHYQRHVAPKERKYHREAWLLHNELEMRKHEKS